MTQHTSGLDCVLVENPGDSLRGPWDYFHILPSLLAAQDNPGSVLGHDPDPESTSALAGLMVHSYTVHVILETPCSDRLEVPCIEVLRALDGAACWNPFHCPGYRTGNLASEDGLDC